MAIENSSSEIKNRSSRWGLAGLGALWGVLSAFPIAVLLVATFRFPIPFGGITHGIEFAPHAMFAVLFYGVVLQGFLLLGALGFLMGIVVAAIAPRAPRGTQCRLTCWLATVTTGLCLLLLATLDWFIGPW